MNINIFQNEEQLVTRETFKKWISEGVIYDAARPEKIYINGWIVRKRPGNYA